MSRDWSVAQTDPTPSRDLSARGERRGRVGLATSSSFYVYVWKTVNLSVSRPNLFNGNRLLFLILVKLRTTPSPSRSIPSFPSFLTRSCVDWRNDVLTMNMIRRETAATSRKRVVREKISRHLAVLLYYRRACSVGTQSGRSHPYIEVDRNIV